MFSTVRLVGIFINYQVPTGEWTYIWVLNSIPLVIACFCASTKQVLFLWLCGRTCNHEWYTSSSVFIVHGYCSYLGFLCFHITFVVAFFFNLWEELPWNRIRIVLNLRIAFGRMVVFTVSVLPFHEHEDLCAFFVFIISLSCVWTFSLYRFIPWYFVAPVNRTVSRTFLSHIVVFSNGNATDLAVLVLLPFILLKIIISSRDFLMESLCVESHHPQTGILWPLPLLSESLSCLSLRLFLWLTSRTTLNRNAKSSSC